RVEELLLGGKVEVERAFADARRGRDVVDGHGVELARGEHLRRRSQNLRALAGIRPASCHGSNSRTDRSVLRVRWGSVNVLSPASALADALPRARPRRESTTGGVPARATST